MSGKYMEPRAHDLEEEQNASARITAQLADKPIIGTSGNEEHRLTPVDVKVRVGLTEQGQELAFVITHKDRHHPELVFKTIEAELAKLPELAGITPKALDAKNDYCPKKGEMIIRYAAAGDTADNIIHALSDSYEQQKKPDVSQVAVEFQSQQPVQPSANDSDWVAKTTIAKTIEHFTGRG